MLKIHPLPEKILSEDEISQLYSWPDKAWIRASMVQTLDGSVTDETQRTVTISDDADKFVFRLLRQLSEVIIIGSKTAQSEPYLHIKINEKNKEIRRKLKLTQKPRVAIVSNHLNFTKEWLKSRVDDDQPIIYTSQSSEANIKAFIGLAEFVFCGQKEVDLKSVKQDLVRRSFKRILCEGGPTLLHALFKDYLVDELDLTINTQFATGDKITTLLNGAEFRVPITFKPQHVLQQGNSILLKYISEKAK